MPFRKLPLWHFLLFYHPEISRGQYVASLLLPFSVQYSLSSFRKVQSRLPTFWWDACFPCSTERTLRLLLEPRFPMLAHEKTFPWLLYFFYCHQRLILGAFSPSNFFFVLPSQTALESNHAHLFQMEIILHLQDTNPLECVDRSSLWVSLLALSIYFHLNQLSLKTHKTWSSAMCVFHYEKSWAHIVDISLTASLQMLIWTC